MVKRCVSLLVPLLLFSACATVPAGPSVMVLPGAGKPFEQFQAAAAVCRQWAQQRIGMAPGETASASTVGGAAAGTLLGAAAGAAIGAASGHPGVGAAVGAGSGLLLGTAVGASGGQSSGGELQRRYDMAYQQCMYAKGNQIPTVVHSPWRGVAAPPPPPPPPPPPAIAPAPPSPAPPTGAAPPSPPQGSPPR